jgi:hypothetical protein
VSTVEVRGASKREEQAVIDVMTLAFSTDPMARWAYPHPQTYLAIWPETIKAFGGNGFAHGTVHLVDGGGAAAMWLPPGVPAGFSEASRPARPRQSSRCCASVAPHERHARRMVPSVFAARAASVGGLRLRARRPVCRARAFRVGREGSSGARPIVARGQNHLALGSPFRALMLHTSALQQPRCQAETRQWQIDRAP